MAPRPAVTYLRSEIHEIFTVDLSKTTNGACGERGNILKQWLMESIKSVDVALEAPTEYRQNAAVRKAVTVFFGIKNDPRGTKSQEAADDIEREC